MQDAGLDQPAQAIAEDVARRAEAALEVAKARDAVEGIADHQQCPAITEQVGAAGNGQGLLACMLWPPNVVAV